MKSLKAEMIAAFTPSHEFVVGGAAIALGTNRQCCLLDSIIGPLTGGAHDRVEAQVKRPTDDMFDNATLTEGQKALVQQPRRL